MPPWNKIAKLCDVDLASVGRFSCGHDGMDEWFHERAAMWATIGRCGVHVAVSGDEVVGFFSLSPVVAVASSYPKRARAGKTDAELGAWLIGRLGVNVEYGGHGVGTCLLWHAIKMACVLSEVAGGVAVVIEPKDRGLADWYMREGFTSPSDDWSRLYLPMKVARTRVAGLGNDYFMF